MTDVAQHDIWALDHAAPLPAADGASVLFRTLENISPLGTQFEQTDPNNVPDGLMDVLFGQAETDVGQTSSPLRTFVILDAAQILGLPEILETSGLDHACLFQGTGEQDMRDVAPWIVHLDKDHTFTRGLFVDGDASWQLWGTSSYVLLRSRDTLDAVRKHFRRFTKFEDTNGTWLFFRFYDPDILHLYLDEADIDFRAGFFAGPQDQIIETVVYHAGQSWFEGACQHIGSTPNRKIDTKAARRIALLAAADRELANLEDRAALQNAAIDRTHFKDTARATVLAVHPLGFRGRFHLRYFIAWNLVYGADLDPLKPDIQHHLNATTVSTETRFQAISELIRSRLGQRMGALFD
ncbi:hypothetical protein ASD8599_04018 [Ascidiaceihabitans donghaensis]|uniref:DUF4123 domain-containing protein n=1 Tax=Ascidiaceihabitans donghaensis TaxID=1510460 RepID=A0A2R8BPQ0_9RHOB|nr:DUF4123 domain-containing protein [Ascidiaceihabitans donghaensis]SPH27552.1 hypothetical protein ASD8599_04018 [Ascidiaceihabitans donghaensis]